MPSDRTLLIDGDIVVYRATAACEEEIDWGEGNWTLHSDERRARQLVDTTIREYQRLLDAPKVIMAFSCTQANWRKEVLPQYKWNRAARKPLAYRAVVDYCKSTYKSHSFYSLEGDDVLGLLATGPKSRTREYIVVTEDKDLFGVPCRLWLPREGAAEPQTITVEEADQYHLCQTLSGDRTDGYDGCPGIGTKRADALIRSGGGWPAVVAAYRKAGLGEAAALQNARVARILRWGEYDLETSKINLWSPK